MALASHRLQSIPARGARRRALPPVVVASVAALVTAALLAVSGSWPFVLPLLLIAGVLGWEILAAPLRFERAISSVTGALDDARSEVADLRDRFELTFHEAVTPMALVAPPRRVRRANRALVHLLGRPELARGDEPDLLPLVHPEDHAALDELLARPAEPGRHHEALVRWRAADQWRWGRTCVSRTPLGSSHGDLLLQVHDVTAHRQAEDLLRGQAEVLEMIARRAPIRDTLATIAHLATLHRPAAIATVVLVSEDRATFDVPVGLDHHPGARNALAGRRVSAEHGPFGPVVCHGQPVICADLAVDTLWHGLEPAVDELAARSGWAVPITDRSNRRTQGVLAWFWPEPHLPDDADRGVAAICTHLAGLAVVQASVEASDERSGLDDELTGLPNRALFLDRVATALARAERRSSTIGVALVDLDAFAALNEHHGTERADELLSTIAGRLIGAVRPGDTVARLGGDRFGVLCEEVASAGEVHRIVARLTDAVSVATWGTAPRPDEGDRVAASIGLALADDVAGDTSREQTFALLRAADAALTVAKAQGGDRAVVFDEALRARTVAHRRGEAQLCRALEQGEIWVAYQPIVDLATGCVESVEALARWDHPQDGPVPPRDFLAVAEDTGLVAEIDDLVLVHSLRELCRWRQRSDDRHHVVMAVNLLGARLRNPDLAGWVERSLDAAGIPASRLSVEVPEPVLARLSPAERSVLLALAELGLELAIDDAGTTGRTLDLFEEWTPGRAKLAWGTLEHCSTDPDGPAATAARAIASAAATTGTRLVAKGVENEHQLRAAIDLGCQSAQGFLLGRPEPAEVLGPRLGRKLLSGAAVRRALPVRG